MSTPADARSKPPARIPPAQDVFLSPRVVDGATFEELGAALRAIVDSSIQAGEALRAKVAEAEASARRMSESTTGLHARAELSTKLISTLDQRLEHLENLVARAETSATAVTGSESRAAEIEALVAARLASRSEQVASEAEATLNHRAKDAIARAEADLARRVDDLLQARLGALLDRADKATTRLEPLVAAIDDRSGPARERILSALVEIEGRLEQLRAGIDLASRQAERVEVAGTRAGALVDSARAEELSKLADRIEAAHARATESLASLAPAVTSVENTRRELAQTIDGAAHWLDRLSEREATIRRSLEEAVQLCETADAALESRKAALQSAVEEPVAMVRAEVDRAGAVVRAITAAAEDARRVESARERVEASITLADAARLRLDADVGGVTERLGELERGLTRAREVTQAVDAIDSRIREAQSCARDLQEARERVDGALARGEALGALLGDVNRTITLAEELRVGGERLLERVIQERSAADRILGRLPEIEARGARVVQVSQSAAEAVAMGEEVIARLQMHRESAEKAAFMARDAAERAIALRGLADRLELGAAEARQAVAILSEATTQAEPVAATLGEVAAAVGDARTSAIEAHDQTQRLRAASVDARQALDAIARALEQWEAARRLGDPASVDLARLAQALEALARVQTSNRRRAEAKVVEVKPIEPVRKVDAAPPGGPAIRLAVDARSAKLAPRSGRASAKPAASSAREKVKPGPGKATLAKVKAAHAKPARRKAG